MGAAFPAGRRPFATRQDRPQCGLFGRICCQLFWETFLNDFQNVKTRKLQETETKCLQ